MFNILRVTDLINREGMVNGGLLCESGFRRSVVRLPGPWFLHRRGCRVAYIKQET